VSAESVDVGRELKKVVFGPGGGRAEELIEEVAVLKLAEECGFFGAAEAPKLSEVV
jgi:hypothetical protein